MYFCDLNEISNGKGKSVYNNKLDAYSFSQISSKDWLEKVFKVIIESIENKTYLPIYRIGDGELRFLYGVKINFKNQTIRYILRYLKYEIFSLKWKTSWGEEYSKNEIKDLKTYLKNALQIISKEGFLAIYWNENGLNAFTEYNSKMLKLFKSINIELNDKNYIPFHFAPALITNYYQKIICNNNILIISSLDDYEFKKTYNNLKLMGALNIERFTCSSTNSMNNDYKDLSFKFMPNIVLVAAGIGSAKALLELKYLNCPVIDIGGFIHVLSGKLNEVHGGFFKTIEI